MQERNQVNQTLKAYHWCIKLAISNLKIQSVIAKKGSSSVAHMHELIDTKTAKFIVQSLCFDIVKQTRLS